MVSDPSQYSAIYDSSWNCASPPHSGEECGSGEAKPDCGVLRVAAQTVVTHDWLLYGALAPSLYWLNTRAMSEGVLALPSARMYSASWELAPGLAADQLAAFCWMACCCSGVKVRAWPPA